MNEWISVDKRLPAKSTPVLVWWAAAGGEAVVAVWWEGDGGEPIWHEALNREYEIQAITHWMPLLEGPK